MSQDRKPRIQCMSHVTLCVRDLAIAEEFYVGLLGAKLERRMDRAEFLRQRPDRGAEADAENSPLHIALKFGDEDRFDLQLFLQPWSAQPVEQGHPHLAVHVNAEDLGPFKEVLERRGVPVDGPGRLGPPRTRVVVLLRSLWQSSRDRPAQPILLRTGRQQ